MKETPDVLWLKEIHSQVLQQSLKDLDGAFQNFFRRVKRGEKPGYPKFKKKGINESFRFPQGVKIEDSKVFLPKIGWVKFRRSQDIQGTLHETTIVQEGEDWFIAFSCSWEKIIPQIAIISEDQAIGIILLPVEKYPLGLIQSPGIQLVFKGFVLNLILTL